MTDKKAYDKEWWKNHPEKAREYRKKYRERRRKYAREYQREYSQRPEVHARIVAKDHKHYAANKSEINRKRGVWRQKNREIRMSRVHALLQVKLGEACTMCGSTENLERHHPDYNKPLEVLTLCRRCHGKTRRLEHKV